MDLISKPELVEEEVTDLDIAFTAGPVRQLTLRKGDSIEPSERLLVMTFEDSGEIVTINRAHVLWYSLRGRTERRPANQQVLKGEAAPASEPPSQREDAWSLRIR